MASARTITRIRTQLFTLAAPPEDLDDYLIQYFGCPLECLDQQTAAALVLILDRFLFDLDPKNWR